MAKFTVASRVVLIAVSVYGIYHICELFKPHFPSTGYYIASFIMLLVVAFWSIIDWNIKAAIGGRSK